MKPTRAAAGAACSVLLAVAASSIVGGCGSGGTSAFLPPGDPTTAGPGNKVIYAAMAQGNRIDAFRLGTDGLMPSTPFDTIFVDNPRRLAVNDGVLYASLRTQIVSIRLGPDGSMPEQPTGASLIIDQNDSQNNSEYDPIDIEVRDDILYVAASGVNTVQSFELEPDGDIPTLPSGIGEGQFPSDFSSLELDGDYLYSGSRGTQYIELFLLERDGNVPPISEPQNPQDAISLPDSIKIRDSILYVTSSSDRSIRAYKLRTDGTIPPQEDSRTKSEEFYSDILLNSTFFYASAYNAGRIDVYQLDANGMIPENPPVSRTQADPASYPAAMIEDGGILYVAQAGLNRIDAYAIDRNGYPPLYPTSSTTPAPGKSFPLSLAMLELD